MKLIKQVFCCQRTEGPDDQSEVVQLSGGVVTSRSRVFKSQVCWVKKYVTEA